MRDLRVSELIKKIQHRRAGKAKHACHPAVQVGARFALCPSYMSTMCHITVAALLLLCLGIGAAHAHAFLDHADPRVGNTVRSPRTVSMWFTQNLESSFSDARVFNSSGAVMSTGKASVDGADRKLLHVAVKSLPPGTYTVKWHVLSVDTHTTEGNFTFNVSQ